MELGRKIDESELDSPSQLMDVIVLYSPLGSIK